MADENDSEPAIKVTDRRSFTRDGLKRDQEAVTQPKEPKPSPEPRREVKGEGFTIEPPPSLPEEMAPGDAAFLNLVVSIYQSGCIHLGLAGESEQAVAEALDFEAARGTIEMLLALREKTKGNLSPDEGRILETLVAELQMAYALKVSDA